MNMKKVVDSVHSAEGKVHGAHWIPLSVSFESTNRKVMVLANVKLKDFNMNDMTIFSEIDKTQVYQTIVR